MLWPAALVPAVNHEVVDSLIDVALIIEHVQELVSQGNFGEDVQPNVVEWVFVEKVLVFIYFGHIVVSEAFWVQPNGGVVVHAPLETGEEPVGHTEFESNIWHVYQVWNVLEILLLVVNAILIWRVASEHC